MSHRILLDIAELIGRRPSPLSRGQSCEILLTANFNSESWIDAHIRPIAMSQHCSRLYVVATHKVPTIPNVVVVSPPRWLIRFIGAGPARLALFSWAALRRRPQVVGGLHLLVNGLAAILLARLIGARAVYFSVGGPIEVLGGGVCAGNRLFEKLRTPDLAVERQLIRTVGRFDLVITMGTKAMTFFRRHGLATSFCPVAGGIDSRRFYPATSPPTWDLILVARLARLKTVDVFLNAIQLAASELPSLRAVIVGDGELRGSLEHLAAELGIEGHVRFVGHQTNVADWLRSARVFVLTSYSEGLALAVVEAMMCGLPTIVSDVGDLADIVEDGVNGYLVERGSPTAFAARIRQLLGDDAKLHTFSEAALRSARRYDVAAVAQKWDEIFLEWTRTLRVQ